MVETVGSQTFNPFANVDRVRAWLGGVKQVSRIDELCRMLAQGSPTYVRSKNLGLIELEYGNHQSTTQHDELIWKKVLANVRIGRAIPFEAWRALEIKHLRISLLGMVQGSKPRIIHDLSFPPGLHRSSLNHSTNFEKARHWH